MSTLELAAVLETPIDFDQLLQRVHAIGKDVLAVHAADVDRDARFPHEAIRALREAELLSAYVPEEYGGMGLDILQISKICEVLGQYCGSSAMIYAMHMIQVACVVHHAQQSEFFRKYLRQLVEEQRLMASATTEVGVSLDLPLRDAREQFEKQYFLHHIRREEGNMSRVADRVGLERTHLYRKLKQLGIRPSGKSEDAASG